MVDRITLFFLLLFLFIAFEGCMRIIDKTTLPADEIEKIQTVRLIESNRLDESPYKVIKKVEGYSCNQHYVTETLEGDIRVLKESSREKAIEQVKVQAVRAGGNAITNLVCLFEEIQKFGGECWIECTADAIQVD